MTTHEIKNIAQRYDIDLCNKSIEEIIRAIQIKEGNTPCFTNTSCTRYDCCWRGNCSKAMKIPIVHLFEGVSGE